MQRVPLLLAMVLAACATQTPLATVPHVDLQRYSGTWYEIARYPNRFEGDCVAVCAAYAVRPDGRIDVLNACRQGRFDGPAQEVRGVARAVEDASNAKLRVQFFWPFSGDYWIIGLDADYQWAVVGTPSRDYLWILSRAPHMHGALYRQLVEDAAALGFDPGRLQLTAQPPP